MQKGKLFADFHPPIVYLVSR